MERDFKGIWIPKELINNKGSRLASLISAIRYNAPMNNLDSVIRELKRKGFLVNEHDPFKIKEALVNKNLKGLGIGKKQCEWCKIHTITLQIHHFPIEKRKGGTQTVNICGNCHQEYHSLYNKLSFKIADEIEAYYN